ncbi:MAG TPA: transcription termination factor NusA [Bryobacteraceae bacterium]|nr:transcription termination factor NusA [Bryobacteraceae bacterium]
MASIYQSIEILSKEKGIDSQIVLDALKDAMLAAARKQYRNQDLVVDLEEESGNIVLSSVKRVVEVVEDPYREMTLAAAKKLNPEAEIGAEIRELKPTMDLGRIAAQTAKQVIMQKVREAERDNVFSEYQGRSGELVNCVIKRSEGVDYIVDIGKTEARLPKKEQSRVENYSIGDRVRCVIKGVERGGKNAGVVVSRAAPELVMRLFEQEVPEIYDGTVTIKACAREAGERTKIAVSSRDRDVDSVGACVGMKGMRVQSIIRELRGEKIDIIEYSDDPVVYATKALSPAKISRVTIVNPTEKHMEVVVDDLQLSLAIGKRGQNVRLAAKLIGWKIDIKSEEEKRREVQIQMADMVISGAPVSVLIEHGLEEGIVEKLVGADIGTVEKLGSMTPEELEAISEIDEEVVGQIQAAVVSFYGQYEQEEPAPSVSPITEAANEDEGEPGSEEVATGVLEQDLARHEAVAVNEANGTEVLDLGRVEGLSAAPSIFDDQPEPIETAEKHESATIKSAE